MKSAIVNAANNRCLGGRGVDGAISAAGGEALLLDRHALPIIHGTNSRCMTGNAVITGPNNNMHLRTPFVIHAVGPNYSNNKYKGSKEKGDIKLHNAYVASMVCARDKGLESVAFSLLSAGKFRGNRSIHEVLNIAMRAIILCAYGGLMEVHLCGHSHHEYLALIEVARDLGLIRELGA